MSHNANSSHLSESQASSRSSSSNSQPFEIAPREDPFLKPAPDLPSKKSSNPFKRVQASRESFHSSHSNHSNPDPHQLSFQNRQSRAIDHSECKAKIEELTEKMARLYGELQAQKEQYESESLANQIYSQGFTQLRGTVVRMGVVLEGESVEELIQTTQRLLATDQAGLAALLEEKERKIDQLRLQLVHSSENNINALFSTEITEAHCLQLQVKKMYAEIERLKSDLMRQVKDKQEHISISVQQSHLKERQKLMEMYQKLHSERERQPNLSEVKLGEMIEGYRWLRDEYKGLENTINSLTHGQQDVTQSLVGLKKDITHSIQHQITELQVSLKRPSSSQSQSRHIKQLQIKLNHLVNTLNAPQQANIQKQSDEDSYVKWRSVEHIRKVTQLESDNCSLHNALAKLSHENQRLQNLLAGTRSSAYHSPSQAQRQHGRRYEGGILWSPQSEGREQQIVEWSGEGGNNNYVQSNSLNRHAGSQSYHQSSSKASEVELLYAKIQEYEHKLRQKQLRINELQNIILEHIQARPHLPNTHQADTIERLQMYISNLKMLLHQARQQSERVKQELIKWHQMGLHRQSFHSQQDRSFTISDRTTKHGLAQTRLIPKKVAHVTYEASRARLQAEEDMEKLCKSILQFIESLGQSDTKRETLKRRLLDCLLEVILELKERQSSVYSDVLLSEEVRQRISAVGIEIQ